MGMKFIFQQKKGHFPKYGVSTAHTYEYSKLSYTHPEYLDIRLIAVRESQIKSFKNLNINFEVLLCHLDQISIFLHSSALIRD